MEEGGRRELKRCCVKRLGLMLLALKMDEGTLNQKMQAISRGWKGKEKDTLVEPPKNNSALLTPWF